MAFPSLVDPLIYGWAFGLFLVFALTMKATGIIQVFVQTYVFISSGHVPMGGIARSSDEYTFGCPTVFQRVSLRMFSESTKYKSGTKSVDSQKCNFPPKSNHQWFLQLLFRPKLGQFKYIAAFTRKNEILQGKKRQGN